MSIHVNQTKTKDGGANFTFDFDTKADAVAALTGQEVQVFWNAPVAACEMRRVLRNPEAHAIMRDMILFAAKEHLAPTIREGESRFIPLPMAA